MKKSKKSIFTALFAILFCFKALAIDPPPPIITSKNLNAQGYMTNLPTGTYLQLINFNKNWNSWYHEVQVLDQTSMLPTKAGTLKVSQAYLLDDMSNTISNDLQFIDESSGKTITGYPGQKYIIVGSQNSGWKTHTIQFVDDEGAIVDHKGIPVSTPRTYKVTQKYLDADRFKKSLRNLNNIQRTATTGGNVDSDCVTTQTGTVKPAQPPRLDPVDLNSAKSSYEYLKKNRSALRGLGLNGCMSKKEKIQDEYLSNHPYGKLSLSQRANKIFSDAQATLSGMKQSSAGKNSTSNKHYSDFVNGHYIDPLVTPQIASCISFQETKGNLNPYAVNYTLCNTKMTSTAHGLGQITQSTMKGLVNNPDGDLMPLNSPVSKKYAGMSTTDIHSKMSGDVGMQLEILMRILSSNAKFIRWKNKGLSESEILRRAVIQYDRDSQSAYIKNVIDRCLPCFNAGGDGEKCYNTLK